MTDWKTKLLSRAGKEVLVKSVIQAIPVYMMQVYKVPKSVSDRISKQMISFFWNKTGNARSTHWINRSILQSEKAAGGLGFKDLHVFNDALLLKQAWRIVASPNSLVATLIQSKYFPNSSLMEATRGYRPSLFWSSLVKVKSFMPQETQNLLSGGEVRWTRESSGLYTVKSGYSLISERTATATRRNGEYSNLASLGKFWRTLWTSNVPPRAKLHAWRAIHNGIPDGEVLDRRCGIKVDACGWCGWGKDSLIHIVRDCWMGKLMGSQFDITVALYDLKGGTMADWIFQSFLTLSSLGFRTLLCVCWILWNSRNDFVHNGRLWQLEEMSLKVRNILASSTSWELHNPNWRTLPMSSSPSPLKVFCDSSWKWINEIGNGSAGWGVVVMSDDVVTAINAGQITVSPSPDHAEGMALWKGLIFGTSLNLTDATFLTDSMAVIKLLALGSGATQPPSWLASCLQLLNSHKGWKVDWIPRDRNVIADFISKKARRELWDWSRTDAVPIDVSMIREG